jgi:hypothetical protein
MEARSALEEIPRTEPHLFELMRHYSTMEASAPEYVKETAEDLVRPQKNGLGFSQGENTSLGASIMPTAKKRRADAPTPARPRDEITIGTIRVIPGPRTPEQNKALALLWARALVKRDQRHDTHHS